MGGLNVNINHVTRVEGHGSVHVEVEGGEVRVARLEIDESPRYFEALVQGRDYSEVAVITSRICGICAVAHTTVSLRATESAFGITPSVQTTRLRKLMYFGEIIQSHVLHLYFLVAPDFFGAASVVPMAESQPEAVRTALRLKGLANDLCAVVGGRHVHPIALAVNGITKLPDMDALLEIRRRLIDARKEVDYTMGLLRTLRLPEFERETEYLSLKGDTEYPFIEGRIVSSLGNESEPEGYKTMIHESVVVGSTAKHVRTDNGTFMVGALSRFNNNAGLLHPKALETADSLGLKAPCHNPYMINVAQFVETVHCIEEAISLIGTLAETGMEEEPRDVKHKAGRGVAAVEAPRGLLFHDYTYDAGGKVTDANCIIPTGQNIANIEADMRAVAPGLVALPREEAELKLKMLVRAYDPCISCATHSIDVKFIVRQ